MPYGPKNSPPTFMRYINEVLRKLISKNLISVYIDIILMIFLLAQQALMKTWQSLKTFLRF